MDGSEGRNAGLNKEQDALLEMMRIENEQKRDRHKRNMGCLMTTGALGAIVSGIAILFVRAADSAIGPMSSSKGDALYFLIAAAAFVGMTIWAWVKRNG